MSDGWHMTESNSMARKHNYNCDENKISLGHHLSVDIGFFSIGYWHCDSLNVVVWMVVAFVIGIEVDRWATPGITPAALLKF